MTLICFCTSLAREESFTFSVAWSITVRDLAKAHLASSRFRRVRVASKASDSLCAPKDEAEPSSSCHIISNLLTKSPKTTTPKV